MFKFIFIFLYLSFCTTTNLFSMAPDAPTPQQRFSIFKSLNIDHEKQLVYREIIPIIATGDKQEAFDFRPFILENKITGSVAFQIQVSHYTNINRRDEKNNTNTLVFDLLSITFISKDENRSNAKSLPIVKSSKQSLSIDDLNPLYIGSVYLFPDDITNLITSITKDSSSKEILSIVQKPFPTSIIPKKLTQQSANQFLPMELSIPSREFYITLKNDKEEEFVFSFSPYYTAVLRSALEFYIRLL